MMFAITVQVKQDLDRLRKLSPAGFTDLVKDAMRNAALFWHTYFLPWHFTRDAYSRYPKEYPGTFKMKKPPGIPLVESGNLRDTLVKTSSIARLSATSNHVHMELRYGRPAKYSPEKMARKVRAIMREKGCDRRTAENMAYSNAGYSHRARFEAMVTAMRPDEIRKISNFIRGLVLASLGGKARTAWGNVPYIDVKPFSPWGASVDASYG